MDPATDWVVDGGGGALDLDGTNDYIKVPDNNPNSLNAGTVSAWVNARATGYYPSFVKKVASGGESNNFTPFAIDLNYTSFNLRFTISDDSASLQSKTIGSVTQNQWHHLTMSWDGSTFSGYKDGVLLFADAQTVAVSNNVQPLYIGTQRTGSSFWASIYFMDALIDDVRIYDRALDTGEIRQLWGGGQRGAAYQRGSKLLAAPTSEVIVDVTLDNPSFLLFID
jgi:hypothetical protein